MNLNYSISILWILNGSYWTYIKYVGTLNIHLALIINLWLAIIVIVMYNLRDEFRGDKK